MKKNKVIIFLLLFVKQAIGCWIVDPTYDFSFKTLFGSNGQELANVTPKDRLVAFLNSFLTPSIGITISNLEYDDSVNTSGDGKDVIFDIMAKCECYSIGSENTYFIDLEMQRAKTKNYVERTIFYGQRLADLNSIYGLPYADQPRNVVVSIIDDVLDDFPHDVVFFLAPCFKKVFSQEENPTPDGKVVYPSPIQVFIQLPLLCQEINKKTSNIYTSNDWLKLLASRRIFWRADSRYTPSGAYQIKEENFPSDGLIANSLEVLKTLNNGISDYNKEILRINRNLDENLALYNEKENLAKQVEDQSKQLEDQSKQLEDQSKQLEDIIYYTIKKDLKTFYKDKKNYEKSSKKPKKSSEKQAFEHVFPSILKRKNIPTIIQKDEKYKEYIASLLSESAEFSESNDDSMQEDTN